MNEDVVWDRAKGELRILGQRHAAVDIQGLSDHLDMMIGHKVAEVMMNEHEFRQGEHDAANIRRKKP